MKLCAAMLAAGFSLAAHAQVASPRSFETSWAQLGGGSNRYSAVTLPPPPIATPRWVNTTDKFGNPVSYLGQSPLTVYAGEGANDGLVIAVGVIDGTIDPPSPDAYRLFAVSRSTGATVWQAPIAEPLLESQPGPAIDERNRTAMVCTGSSLQAFRLTDGHPLWTFEAQNLIVNVSPLITTDLAPANRAFITDYKGGFPDDLSPDAQVYCINIDPFDAELNPYQPGQLVWSSTVGTSSGNSVSYLPRAMGGDGLVYVASPGTYFQTPGMIHAFRVKPLPGVPIEPVWTHINSRLLGYFGGVCVVPAPTLGAACEDDQPPTPDPNAYPALYAASYSFFGGTDSANLVKINARTGTLVWSAPANRTRSIPVPVPGGFVALSAGINGHLSIAMVELFQDNANTGVLLWDTSELEDMGGWTSQPVLTRFGGRNLLAAGSLPELPIGVPNPHMLADHLFLIDLSLNPDQPGFIVAEYDGVGGCPAIVGGSLYCVGAIGLAAFGPTPADLDIDQSSRIDINDVIAWERGQGYRDINGDGVVTIEDKQVLITTLRASESALMRGEDR